MPSKSHKCISEYVLQHEYKKFIKYFLSRLNTMSNVHCPVINKKLNHFIKRSDSFQNVQKLDLVLFVFILFAYYTFENNADNPGLKF